MLNSYNFKINPIIPEKTEKLNTIINILQGHKNMPKKDIIDPQKVAQMDG